MDHANEVRPWRDLMTKLVVPRMSMRVTRRIERDVPARHGMSECGVLGSGGVRVVALISGPLIPVSRRGAVYTGALQRC